MDKHYTYTVVLDPDTEQGGFIVRVPALPEIVSFGETEAEALTMAQDAINLVLEDRASRGEPVPEGDDVQVRSVRVTVPA